MTRTTEQRWAANTLCTPSMGHGRKGGHSGSQELLYDGTTSALMFIGGDRSSKHREEVVRRGRRLPASAGAGRLGKLVGSPPPGGQEKEPSPIEKGLERVGSQVPLMIFLG